MFSEAFGAEQFFPDRILAVPQRGVREERESGEVFALHLDPSGVPACLYAAAGWPGGWVIVQVAGRQGLGAHR